MSLQVDEQELRRQIEKRFQKRFELICHLIFFIVVNAVLWFVFKRGFWLQWITLGWGVGLIGHFIQYTSQYGAWSRSRRDAVEREVQREMALRGAYEKPKNDNLVRLTDDGELEAVPADELDDRWSEKSKRQNEG